MSKTNTPTAPSQSGPDANLDSHYGAIGISAVAAALHFKREVKNPAHAPAAPQPREERLSGIAPELAA